MDFTELGMGMGMGMNSNLNMSFNTLNEQTNPDSFTEGLIIDNCFNISVDHDHVKRFFINLTTFNFQECFALTHFNNSSLFE